MNRNNRLKRLEQAALTWRQASAQADAAGRVEISDVRSEEFRALPDQERRRRLIDAIRRKGEIQLQFSTLIPMSFAPSQLKNGCAGLEMRLTCSGERTSDRRCQSEAMQPYEFGLVQTTADIAPARRSPTAGSCTSRTPCAPRAANMSQAIPVSPPSCLHR
jgi:hypothetical protein